MFSALGDDRLERELEFETVDRVPLVLKLIQQRVVGWSLRWRA